MAVLCTPHTQSNGEAMFDQMLEGFRKASESSLQMQQEMLRQVTQQCLSAQPTDAHASTEWTRKLQKTWLESTLELLNEHRASLDSAYQAGIRLIEQTFQISEAKSAEDYRRTMEQLWSNLFETFKSRSEAQLRDLRKWTEKSFEVAQKVQA
jgi:hypothetical protein